MRIAVDALGLPPYGGARSSALAWLTALAELDRDNEYIVFLSRKEAILERLSNLDQRIVRASGRFLPRVWAQICLPRIVRRERIDLVHFMKNLGTFVPCKSVLTINDLTRLAFPKMFSRVDVAYWKLLQPLLLNRVDGIIAISESTKRDIISWFRVPEEKVAVIYPAQRALFRVLVDRTNVDKIRSKYKLSNMILYVGGLAVHKNLITLVKAFFLLQQEKGIPHRLVVVGGQYHTHNETRVIDLVNKCGLQEVIFTGVVPDEDLVALYNAADLFVLPSLYEGFGLVALEAMACGVPVIASRAGALTEVIGDAGILVDNPTDESELAVAMYQVLSDQALKQKLMAAGLRRAGHFSWESTAQSTLKVYQEVVGGKGCAT